MHAHLISRTDLHLTRLERVGVTVPGVPVDARCVGGRVVEAVQLTQLTVVVPPGAIVQSRAWPRKSAVVIVDVVCTEGGSGVIGKRVACEW